MNHAQSNKLNLPTAREELAFNEALLAKHPGNAVLKRAVDKWKLVGKRCKDAIAESKKEGYSSEYEALWKLFDYRTGSKSEAYGAYCKTGIEHEVIMSAVRLYKADIKKGDVTQAHLTTWLNQKRWESYDDIKATSRVKTCPWCHKPVDKLHYHSYKDEKGCYFSAHVCAECKNK